MYCVCIDLHYCRPFFYGRKKGCCSCSGDSARMPTPHVRMDLIEATSQAWCEKWCAIGCQNGVVPCGIMNLYIICTVYILIYIILCVYIYILYRKERKLLLIKLNELNLIAMDQTFFNRAWICMNICEQILQNLADRATRRFLLKNHQFCFVQDIELIPHVCVGPFWCERAQDSPTDSADRHVRISFAAQVEAQHTDRRSMEIHGENYQVRYILQKIVEVAGPQITFGQKWCWSAETMARQCRWPVDGDRQGIESPPHSSRTGELNIPRTSSNFFNILKDEILFTSTDMTTKSFRWMVRDPNRWSHDRRSGKEVRGKHFWDLALQFLFLVYWYHSG